MTWIICAVFGATVFRISSGLAQTAAPITSSGLNTHVNLSAAPPAGTVQYDITTGTRVGTNLFHSFGDFNVPDHNIANFLNDTGLATTNILSRVTGGNVSDIFGTIQTTGFGNANLFLMNPAGIIFGPTASLNVGGSVTFTTADYLRLADGVRFNAILNTAVDMLLSTASVAAFGFLGSNPGAITVQGSQLSVANDTGISLVGGDINIQSGTLENGIVQPAHLSAPNGQINLATAKSPGQFLVSLTAEQVNPSVPNINGASFRSFGSLHITPGSTVDVSQTGNDKVSIRGGQLVLNIQNAVLNTADDTTHTTVTPGQDTIVLSPGSSIISQTFSADRGPDIQIVADRLQFVGSPSPHPTETDLGTLVNIWARTNGSGDAGNITLRTAGNLELINLVHLESTSGTTFDGTTDSTDFASGHAGDVQLMSAHGNILMTGFFTWATSQTGNSSGKTGTVTASATAGDIILDGGSLFTFASPQSGGGGKVEVTAQNLRMMNVGLLSNDNLSQFKPGGIAVTLSDKLTLSGGSFIENVALSPTGAPAGDITLTAKDIVATQGSLISSETYASGPGGHLTIVSDTLQLMDGSQIKSGSTFAPPFGKLPQGITPTGPGGDITIHAKGPVGSILIDGADSGIFTNTEGTGAGGTINLFAKTLMIQNGGTISASTEGFTPSATGGSIDINTTDHITMTNHASITASSANPVDPNAGGIANAGNISINAGQQLDVQNSSITTKAEKASGGNIDIRAIDSVRFANSQISASVGADRGNGGNITIDPKTVVLQNAQILANAQQGNGGNITITTPVFLQDQASRVDASSQFGVSGTITIQSPTSNLSGTVKQLTTKPSETQALLQNRCVALAGGEQSTFIVAGRDALPSEPGGWLSSPLSMDHLIGQGMEHAAGPTAKSIRLSQSPAMVASAGETQVLSLRRLTPPGFLVRTFGSDGLTGCRS